MPELYVAIYEAFQLGDLPRAQELQFLANRFIRIVLAHGVFGAGKAILGMRGIDCGPLVRPLPTLDEAARGQLRNELQAAGFFDSVVEAFGRRA